MPRNTQIKTPAAAPTGAVYLTAAQLRVRYGGVSHMFVERKLKNDPTFPRFVTFNSMHRFWRLDEIEAYERACAKKSA